MSRWLNEFVAALGDFVPGGVPMLGILLFLFTVLVAVLWFTWPAWLPTRWPHRRRRDKTKSDRSPRRWRWPRLGQLRWRWPRLGELRWRWWRGLGRLRWWRRRRTPEPLALPDDHLPDLPASVMTFNADELAAAGRYKEAVRERLRAIVRDLIERGVLQPVPGWTVTELAWAAGRARPGLAVPLGSACKLFSDIWYGLRPAMLEDDRTMRVFAEQVAVVLGDVRPVVAASPEVTR